MKKIIFTLTPLLLLLVTCIKKDKKSSSSVQSVSVQSTPASYTIAYNGNGNTSGSAPLDGNFYHNGNKAAILGDTGNLYKTAFVFMGWNSDTAGTGTNFCPGDSIVFSGTNIKLYAKWIGSSINPASNNTNLNCGGSGWLNPTCSSSSSLTLKGTNGIVEVILTFITSPTTGSYSVSTIVNPSNVQVTILNAPNQPCGITWYGKTGTVNVNATSNSINASFSNIQCTQSNYTFPVVSLSGSVGCY